MTLPKQKIIPMPAQSGEKSDPFAIFLNQFDISPNGKTTYELPVKCPICNSGELTAWTGNHRAVNVHCSQGCHNADMGRGMNSILERLKPPSPQAPQAASPVIRISVNRKFVGKISQDATKSVWNRFNGTFKTEALDLAGLAAAIQAGHAVTAVHNNYRKRDNFISAQHIGLDFDTEDARSSLDTLQSDEFISKHGALLYTTASHTPAKPRARVLFILEEPITDASQYAQAARALVGRFGMVDGKCKDAARVWFGAKGCEVRLLGNLLPLQVLENLIETQPSRNPRAGGAVSVAGIISQGKRNSTLTSLAGTMRRRGMEFPEINAALQETNARRCEPPLPESDVETIAKSISGYAVPPLVEIQTPPEHARLLEDAINVSAALRTGALHKLANALNGCDPFTVAAYAEKVKAAGLCNKTDFINAVKQAKQEEGDGQTHSGSPTDDELGARWLAKYPDTAYGLGEFRRYNEGVWRVLPVDSAKAELSQVIEAAKTEGIRPTLSRLQSVLELVRVKVAVPDSEWDADPDLLPCRNGVLHIPTRELRPHSPEYHFTSGLDYDYNPSADCPTFKYALESTIPEVMDFVQEFAGYSLTVDTRYEIALWFCGPAGSGKSTLLTGLQEMLGARAGILGLVDIERSRFAMSNLPGKTLLVSTEQPARYISTSHILNAIISGEPIELDRKFREPIQLTPRAKIAWAMNELPRLESAVDGLFRRVQVVRFPARPEAQRDPEVKESIKTEGAGILNWALAGLERLRARGSFDIPDAVRGATAQFQENNDIPAAFVAERCLTGPDYRSQATPLYLEYRQWCLDSGHKPQSSTSISEDWQRLGFERIRSVGKTYYRGVGLISDTNQVASVAGSLY